MAHGLATAKLSAQLCGDTPASARDDPLACLCGRICWGCVEARDVAAKAHTHMVAKGKEEASGMASSHGSMRRAPALLVCVQILHKS